MNNTSDINIKEIEAKWGKSDFRKKANQNWTVTKIKINKDDTSKLAFFYMFLKIVMITMIILGVLTLPISFILLSQEDKNGVTFFTVGIFSFLLAYFSYKKTIQDKPRQQKNRALLDSAYDRMINNKDDYQKIELGTLSLNEYKKKYQYKPEYQIDEYSWLKFDIKHFGKCFMIGAFVPPFGLYMLIRMQKDLGLDGNLGILLAWFLYYLGIIQLGDNCFYHSGVSTGNC